MQLDKKPFCSDLSFQQLKAFQVLQQKHKAPKESKMSEGPRVLQ